MLSLAGFVLGGIAAFAIPLVAFVPRVGVTTVYRLRPLRYALAAMGLAIALAQSRRPPASRCRLLLPITILCAGLSWVFDPARMFRMLDCPPHVPADRAGLGAEAFVLGLDLNNTAACAWPLEMLVPRHLVNDRIGGTPVLVSY
jgi:hypothetical protein